MKYKVYQCINPDVVERVGSFSHVRTRRVSRVHQVAEFGTYDEAKAYYDSLTMAEKANAFIQWPGATFADMIDARERLAL